MTLKYLPCLFILCFTFLRFSYQLSYKCIRHCTQPISPILCFATYCGLMVTFNYVLNVCVIFPALCQYDIWQQNGSTSRFVDLRNKKNEPKKNKDAEEETGQEDFQPVASPKLERSKFYPFAILVCIFSSTNRLLIYFTIVDIIDFKNIISCFFFTIDSTDCAGLYW